MRFELCETCCIFTKCSKVDGAYICDKCRGIKPVEALPDKVQKVFTEETKQKFKGHFLEKVKEAKAKNPNVLNQFDASIVGYGNIKKMHSTAMERVKKFFVENDQIVVTVKELIDKLEMHERNVSYCLFMHRKDGLVYSRSVHDFVEKKKYSLYSANEKNVNIWRDYELQSYIYRILEKATEPKSTKSIAVELNIRRSSVSKNITRYLKPYVNIYRVESEKFFVLRKKRSIIEKIFSYYPTAIKIKQNDE